MKQSVAIVTGAGQGIGRAIALRLAQDSISVVVVDLRKDTAVQVAEEVRDVGGHALPLAIDITVSEQREQMIQVTLDHFQHVDILVNNAGTQRVALPLDVTEEHWDIIMNVNAKAVYFCCQGVLKHMVAQQRGCIVNMASIAGKMASTIYHPIYNVSKASVLAMTKTLALAYAPSGIRIPMARVGELADVAEVVSFLVGPKAQYMTGQALNVDGGILTY